MYIQELQVIWGGAGESLKSAKEVTFRRGAPKWEPFNSKLLGESQLYSRTLKAKIDLWQLSERHLLPFSLLLTLWACAEIITGLFTHRCWA